MYKFHLRTRPDVQRVFIYAPGYFCEMREVPDAMPNIRVWNGEVPDASAAATDILHYELALHQLGATEYLFNDLFSRPIVDGVVPVDNMIVVNTPPGDCDAVVIDIAPDWAVLLGLPPTFFLSRFVLPPDHQVRDMLARGIDPSGQPYVRRLQCRPAAVEPAVVIRYAAESPIRVTCYRHVISGQFPVERYTPTS